MIANAVVGFVQEGRAEQAMEAIRQMLARAPPFFATDIAEAWRVRWLFLATLYF